MFSVDSFGSALSILSGFSYRSIMAWRAAGAIGSRARRRE
jgi:hypothetical protein